MNETAKLVEYGAPLDPQSMVAPPDVTELVLEPRHPGEHDNAYLQRRQELFERFRAGSGAPS